MRLLNQSFKDWQVSSKQWPVDYLLLAGLVALMVMGLTMVASSSVAIGEKRFDDPLHYLWRQLFSLGLGVLAAIIFVQFPLAFWRKRRGFLFLLGLGLLLLVLIFGREINGSQRWLPLGVMNFQVSEFMKMAVVLIMAGYLDRHGHAVRESYEAVFRLALPFGVMALLLLMEPDFGSTFVIAVILTGMLLIAGAPWRFFVITVLPIALLLITMVITSPYRLARVTNFLDPWSDPFGQGYQLTKRLSPQVVANGWVWGWEKAFKNYYIYLMHIPIFYFQSMLKNSG